MRIKKERSQILKPSPWAEGTRRPLSSSSGLAACAGLVVASLSQRQNDSGPSRARVGLVRLRGWATRVNLPPTLQLHTEAVCWLFLSASTHILRQLVQARCLAPGKAERHCCPQEVAGSLLPGAHVGVDGHTVVSRVAELLLADLGAAGQGFVRPGERPRHYRG